MNNKSLNVGKLSKTYNGRQVMEFGPYEFEPGVIYAVIGANGCGKSTLGKLLSGIVKPDAGRTDTENVGYLPQKPYAFRMNVEKNIKVAVDNPELEEYYIRELGLEPLRTTGGDKLSGGEAARMALARTLMKDFDLLILDEPTAAMDMESTATAERLIKEYRDRNGSSLLLITHNIQQARRVGDRLLFIKDGRLVEDGDCRDHLAKPETEELKEFLEFYG